MDFEGGKTIQRFPAEDLIKANGQAEAAELSRTRDRLREADEMMQEIRSINLKNIELQEKISTQLSKIESYSNAAKTSAEEARVAAGRAREASEKLLTNAGGASDDSLVKEITSSVEEKVSKVQFPDLKEDLLKLSSTLEEVIHKEDVKVYKNVQASVDKALEDQTKKMVDELTEVIEDTVPGNKGILIMVILTFIISLANLGIWVADYIGFLNY